MDITKDEFYEFKNVGGNSPESFADVNIPITRLKRLRDAIVNIAPYELISPTSDIAPIDRRIENIIGCCHDHQRQCQDYSLLNELEWRFLWTHTKDGRTKDLAQRMAAEVHGERQKTVREFYQAIFEKFADHPVGNRIDIVDATPLQESNGLKEWGTSLKNFLESNSELARGGMEITRVILAGIDDVIEVSNPVIPKLYEVYSRIDNQNRLQGKIIDPQQSQVIFGFKPFANVDQLERPSVLSIQVALDEIKSLGMQTAFSDIPAFDGLIRDSNIGRKLNQRGQLSRLLRTSLNHTFFGNQFVIHLNQYFWITRVVTSPAVLADLHLMNMHLQDKSGFNINRLQQE
jgi:hypothetical protein